MSFYSVTNPTTFSVVSDTRKFLVNAGKLIRFPATQQFDEAATLTAEQLIAGNIIGDTTSAGFTLTLPSATDLITLLMGPGGFDVSNNDIFSFRAVNLSGSNHTISSGTGGSGSITVTANTEKFINIKITITVSAGSTTYGYTTF